MEKKVKQKKETMREMEIGREKGKARRNKINSMRTTQRRRREKDNV